MIDPSGEDWYRSSKDNLLYWFEGSGDRTGYAREEISNAGMRVSNVSGATGQFDRYNGHNITINADGTITDRGLYVPPYPAELPDLSNEVGVALLEFEGVSALGAAAVLLGPYSLLDAGAWLTYGYLEKRREGQPAAAGTTDQGDEGNIRGGRGRFKTGEDDLDQEEGLNNYVDQRKQENVKNKGTGYVPDPSKTNQRLDNRLNRIRNLQEAIEEFPETAIPKKP